MSARWLYRFAAVLVAAALCILPAAGAYDVNVNGHTFTVSPDENTISDGSSVYHYTFSGNRAEYKIEIVYPDGSSWWWDKRSGYSVGGWSDDYDPQCYADGSDLRDALLEQAPKAPGEPKNWPAIGLLLALGIFNAVAPQASWRLSYGWRFKNAEPSAAALAACRFSGAAAIVLALVLMLV